jgi:hypothetical protein
VGRVCGGISCVVKGRLISPGTLLKGAPRYQLDKSNEKKKLKTNYIDSFYIYSNSSTGKRFIGGSSLTCSRTNQIYTSIVFLLKKYMHE